jgi:hypothetical protein
MFRIVVSMTVCLAISLLCSGSASAYKACIGENENTCKYQWDAKFVYPCGSETRESAAQKICVDPVTKKVLPYQIIDHDSDRSGGACGYVRFEVYCDQPANKLRFCIGQFSRKCPVANDAFFGCYTNPNDAAKKLCTVTVGNEKVELPYRVNKQGETDGNMCGYVWYGVQCFR